jgi:G-protein coupled receptor 98
VNVPEDIASFNLTVLRTQGTFGDIEVNYYIRRINIEENDFRLYGNLQMGGEGTLKFYVGQRRQNITIFIHNDVIPEANEQFEVRLKSPRGGALLGPLLDSIAHVTVLVNDAGNGIFRFSDGSLGMTVDEPGSRHVGTTRASFTVVRENGTIGEVVLGWRIANVTASLDFKSLNGTVLFKDGERRRSFGVETVVDTVPEKEERFLIVLSVVRGKTLTLFILYQGC